jgi:hypothetical protein
MKFLKANWPLLALFLAIGGIMLLGQELENANDEAIAQMMADKAMAKHRAASKAIVEKYVALNAVQDAKIIALQAKGKAQDISVARWRIDSEAKQKKIKTLEGCAVLLDECQQFVVNLQLRCVAERDGLNAEWSSKVELKDAEIAEWKAKDSRSTILIGELTRQGVMLQLKAQRKLVIGPQVGYNPLTKTGYVGFGATYEVFRAKFKL